MWVATGKRGRAGARRLALEVPAGQDKWLPGPPSQVRSGQRQLMSAAALGSSKAKESYTPQAPY
jgi:hypothetical protein